MSTSKLYRTCPHIFTGLGKLLGEYKIKPVSSFIPFVLTAPHCIAILLLGKVKRVKEKRGYGVISHIEESTDWCARMAIVPKPNSKIWICVDLTQLSKACIEKDTCFLQQTRYSFS